MRRAVSMLGVIAVAVTFAATPGFANPRPTRTPMPDKDHARPTRTPLELKPTRTPMVVVPRTQKPTERPTATRTPLVLNQRTSKPTAPPTATRTPLVIDSRPGRATKTPRPTRTPLVKEENPTPIPRATRTPSSVDLRTRKPLPETRPTRTPLVIEQREGKPTKTARPTRTAIPEDQATRTPAGELRPTRTPIPDEEREAHSTKSPRPTRTAVVKGHDGGSLRPTRTLVPTKTATPVPAFNESKVTASCRAVYKKDVLVMLTIRNESGGEITDVTAGDLVVQRAPGTGFSLGSAPAKYTRLTDGRTATFKWRGGFTTASGACGFSVSATANGPNGERVDIPLTDCGTVVTGHSAESDLVPECLGGGAGEGGAAGCGDSTPPDGGTGTGLPDLSIDAGVLSSSMTIEERAFAGGSCAIAERCVGAPGVRKLLRFSTRTPNLGTADVRLGDPRAGGPFVYSACHAHYHFVGYADYRLVGGGGQIVATGHKQAFCLLDLDPVGPNAGEPKYHCLNQGISAGWADVYDRYLDCQWVDITGVPPGSYTLEVIINGGQAIRESTYGNNVARVPVTIP